MADAPNAVGVVPLDVERCYDAVRSRDQRFDGWFVTAVRTTGIYCRPSCPALTPKRSNVEFLPTAAAAQQRGFRACKRCRPDATPGSPEWNSRHDTVARAMRLIADGVVERDGVSGLAHRLGYSARHLNRVLNAELGAGALAIARSQRAHTARLLIETTQMRLTDIAFAAGFGSVRQFNDTVREVFATSPSDLRRRRGGAGIPAVDPGAVRVRLATRTPFDGRSLLEFLAARAVPGVEAFDGTTYRRTLRLPAGPGRVAVTAGSDGVRAAFELTEWSDLATAVARVRQLLDLDADAPAIAAHLVADPRLGPHVAAVPGRRSPGSVDLFETAVRAVIGQQISVAGARTVAARLVAACTPAFPQPPADWGTHLFPAPETLAELPDEAFAMPAGRRNTLRCLAAAVADGNVVLDHGAAPDELRTSLRTLKGIGPWTVDYVAMRGLGHPDVFLATDLGVLQGLDRVGAEGTDSRQWSPWRSYAVHHLWAAAALSAATSDPVTRSAPATTSRPVTTSAPVTPAGQARNDRCPSDPSAERRANDPALTTGVHR